VRKADGEVDKQRDEFASCRFKGEDTKIIPPASFLRAIKRSITWCVWRLGFTIRQAVSRDSEQLVTLSDELIPLDDWAARKAMLFTALNDPASTIFVAEADDTLVGFIEVRVFPDFVEGSLIALIQNLGVKTDYKQRGVGSQLIQRVTDEVETQHATETHVWTEFDNQPAITLYTQHGFLLRGLLLERESERHIC